MGRPRAFPRSRLERVSCCQHPPQKNLLLNAGLHLALAIAMCYGIPAFFVFVEILVWHTSFQYLGWKPSLNLCPSASGLRDGVGRCGHKPVSVGCISPHIKTQTLCDVPFRFEKKTCCTDLGIKIWMLRGLWEQLFSIVAICFAFSAGLNLRFFLWQK